MWAKAVGMERTGPVLDDNGLLLVKPEDRVRVFDFDPFAPEVEAPPVVDTWQPNAVAPGLGSIVWINHNGDDELTVDLAGQTYKVPPQANGVPGRLQIEIPAADYRYTASVPFGSLNSEITVVAGRVTGLNIITGIKEEPEYEIGEKLKLPPVDLTLFQEDLTGLAGAAQPDTTPAALPVTGGDVDPIAAEAPAMPGGLLIKNYAGDTLVFTINDGAYALVDRSEQALPLPPGRYSFTASLPFVATTGIVDLEANRTVELSIAINVAHDLLSVYRN